MCVCIYIYELYQYLWSHSKQHSLVRKVDAAVYTYICIYIYIYVFIYI